jgi:predicted HAD superfamily Cof-like phosphohydrolase
LAHDLFHVSELFKKNLELSIDHKLIDRKALLDSLCDQIVTAVGVAHMFGMDISGALSEVNRSNWSKFVEGKPVFNEHGKIAKGPNYTPPDLARFV